MLAHIVSDNPVAALICGSVKSAQISDPDDYAYRASIVALTQGHLLLTNAQYLARQRRCQRA